MIDQKQCKRATKKGIQCQRKAITGSEYCRIHQPRQVWLPVVVSIIFTIIFTVLITLFFSREAYESELDIQHISRPRIVPAIAGFPVIIVDGVTMIVEKPGFVTSKCGDGPFDYRIEEDGAIKIYGEIRRADGTLVVEANGDHITVIPSTGFDINSDSNACEIVDSDENPIYQIYVVSLKQWKEDRSEIASKIRNNLKERVKLSLDNLSPTFRDIIEAQMQEHKNKIQASRDAIDAKLSKANEIVRLCYIHRKGETWWCVTPDGSQRVDNRESMNEWQSKIKRLFKYPGKKYPGLRLNIQSK